MKNRELIEILKTYDEDAYVSIIVSDYCEIELESIHINKDEDGDIVLGIMYLK